MSCVLFPDDADSQFKKVGKEPSLLSTTSAKSWERCGDSFLDHQGLKVVVFVNDDDYDLYLVNSSSGLCCYTCSFFVQQNIKSSGRKLSVIRKLVEFPLAGNLRCIYTVLPYLYADINYCSYLKAWLLWSRKSLSCAYILPSTDWYCSKP